MYAVSVASADLREWEILRRAHRVVRIRHSSSTTCLVSPDTRSDDDDDDVDASSSKEPKAPSKEVEEEVALTSSGIDSGPDRCRLPSLSGSLSLYASSSGTGGGDGGGASSSSSGGGPGLRQSSLLCVISLPPDTSVDELCNVAQVDFESELVWHIRVVDEGSGQHSLLLHVVSDAVALRVVDALSGRSFRALSADTHNPDTCHVVYLSEIRLSPASMSSPRDPPVGYWQMPTCPRCLERLDLHVSGLVCYKPSRWKGLHCLVCSMLRETGPDVGDDPPQYDAHGLMCMMCEHERAAAGAEGESGSESESSDDEEDDDDDDDDESSSSSDSDSDGVEGGGERAEARVVHVPDHIEPHLFHRLWMCLICGNVACGRYKRSHMVQHFAETRHRFTVELANHFVWDYASDGYVNRLWRRSATTIDSASQASAPSPFPPEEPVGHVRQATLEVDIDDEAYDEGLAQEEQDMVDTKLQSIVMHYNNLLTHQLQEQHAYFESKIEACEHTLAEQLTSMHEYLHTVQAENGSLADARDEAEKRRRAAEKRRHQLQARLKRLQEQTSFDVDLNASLGDPQTVRDDRLALERRRKTHEAMLHKIAQDKQRKLDRLQKRLDGLFAQLSSE